MLSKSVYRIWTWRR